MELSKEEREALYEKWDNPNKKVICPRCGNEIVYEERGASLFVGCKTPKCIFTGLRGI